MKLPGYRQREELLKMKKNNTVKILVIAAVVCAAGFFIFKTCGGNKKVEAVTTAIVKTGDIKISIDSTGTVMPQNRLAIKPPLSGRIEKILVVEGQLVKTGQTLAYMSSSDRAALLDAARAQGEKNLKEWETIYKPIPLVAPINGQVIVRAIEPGQTVTQADAVIVLSDRLIVKAQVDETDVGKIKKGQRADITLDAYQGQTISGIVDHIYYESKVTNNVTIYEVDILPDAVPEYFRSGMSANVDIIQEERKNVLVLPLAAVKKDKKNVSYVAIPVKGKEPARKEITAGISDNDNTEILSGLSEGEVVQIVKQSYSLQKKGDATTSPFMPKRPAGNTRGGGGGGFPH
jgi:macrolide-specific efflux system membrane fusion protein